MIPVTSTIAVDENELEFIFIRASGPGGQNVNKISSAVQLRFDAVNTPSLPEEVRIRLVKLAGKRLTADGILIIQSKRYRTQAQNRNEAINRLIALIRKAAIPPKKRRPTRPSAASKIQRLVRKKRRGETKRLRRPPDPLD